MWRVRPPPRRPPASRVMGGQGTAAGSWAVTGLDLRGQPACVGQDLQRGSFLSWDPHTGLGGRSIWGRAQSASSRLRERLYFASRASWRRRCPLRHSSARTRHLKTAAVGLARLTAPGVQSAGPPPKEAVPVTGRPASRGPGRCVTSSLEQLPSLCRISSAGVESPGPAPSGGPRRQQLRISRPRGTPVTFHR